MEIMRVDAEKIIIKAEDEKIVLSLDEARNLRTILVDMFGDKANPRNPYIYIPYANYPGYTVTYGNIFEPCIVTISILRRDPNAQNL